MKASPGYPIPHESLAEDWGFREAWQNRCVKREQTSHTFLPVSYVKASKRQHLFTRNGISVFFFLKTFFQSLAIFLKCLPNTSHRMISSYKRCSCITFVLTDLQISAAERAVCDPMEREWEQRDAREQLITHVAGRFDPGTVGDGDGDAMCLNVKMQTVVRASLLSH